MLAPFFQGFDPRFQGDRLARPRERLDDADNVAALARRKLTARNGFNDGADCLDGVGRRLDLRQSEAHRAILASREDALQAKAQRDAVALFGLLDRLPGQRLSFPIEQRLDRQRDLVPSATRFPGGVASVPALEPARNRISAVFCRRFLRHLVPPMGGRASAISPAPTPIDADGVRASCPSRLDDERSTQPSGGSSPRAPHD